MGFQRGDDLLHGCVRLWRSADVEWLDLRAKEMVWATGAELCKARGVFRIHKAQDFFVVLDCGDEAFLLAHLTTKPWEQGGKDFAALFLGQGGLDGSAENGSLAASFSLLFLNMLGGFFDQLQSEFIALAAGFSPVDEAVLAHDEAFGLRVFFAGFLHGESEFEAGAHPRNVHDFIAVNFFRHLDALRAGGHGNGGVRVRVVHMGVRDEAVERRVDRGGAGIQVECAMREHADHFVFGGRFQALLGAGCIHALKVEEFGLVKGGEVFFLRCPQVAAGSLHPHHFNHLAGQRVFFGNLGRGVASAGVGDPLVGAEAVRAVNEFFHGIRRDGVGGIPVHGDMFHVGWGGACCWHRLCLCCFFIVCRIKNLLNKEKANARSGTPSQINRMSECPRERANR